MSYTNSNPGWATGYEPKATEWASTWSGKVDAVGGFANNLNVGTGAFVNLSVTGSLNVSGGAAFSGDGSLITFKSTGTTTARSLASRGAEIFNVLDFDADPTGVADSTTAIQAAINAAQASAANGPPPLNGGGGSIDGIAFKAVYLPPGQYTTSYPLIISYPVLFLGEGAKSVTILSANPAYPILAVVPQYLTGHDYYDGDGIVGYIKIANICFKGAPAVTTVTSDGQYINVNQDGHALFFGQAATNPCYCRIDVEDIIIWGAPCDGLSAVVPQTSAVRTAIGAANATFIGYLYVVNLTAVGAGRYGFAMADADDWRLDGADISYSGASNIYVTGGGGQGTSDVNCYFAGLNPAWSGEYNLANNPPTPQKTIVTGPGTSIAYTANAWLPNYAYGVVGTQVQNGGNAYYLDTAGTSASSGGPTGTSSGVNTIIDGTAKWHYLGVVAPVSVYGSAYNVCLFEPYQDIDFYNCKIDCTSYGGVYIYLSQACEVRIVGGAIASGQGSNPSAGNYPAVYVAATNGNNQIKLTNVRMEPPHSYSPTTGFVNYTVQFAAGIVQTISMLQCTMPWGLGAATNAPALIDVGRGGVFNVLDFGADPTGAVDSTAAIQAALTAASAVSGTVFFPPGGYSITSSLQVTGNNVSVLGSNLWNTTILIPGSTNNFDIFELTSSFGGVQIRNLSLKTFGITSGGSTVKYAINDSTGYAVGNIYEDLSINMEGGIYSGPNSGSILGNNIAIGSLKATYGIGWRFDGTNTAQVSNLTITGSGAGHAAAGLQINATNGNTTALQFQNCEFEGNTYACLMQPNPHTIQSTMFANCFFDTSVTDGVLMDGTNGSINRTQFANCWFSSASAGSGLYIKGAVKGAMLSNCQCYANSVDGITVLTGATITGLSVNGCTIAGNTGNGITIGAGVSSFNLTGNTVGPAADFGANANGIIVATGASDSYVIQANNCHGNTTANLTDGGSGTHKQVGNNVIT